MQLERPLRVVFLPRALQRSSAFGISDVRVFGSHVSDVTVQDGTWMTSMFNPGPKTELTLLHGTTLRRAQQITNDQALYYTEPLHCVLPKDRDIAEFFAVRKAHNERGRPALVSILVEDKDFQSFRKRGEAYLVDFDLEDNPALRGRRYWRIEPVAVRILNVRLIEITHEAIS